MQIGLGPRHNGALRSMGDFSTDFSQFSTDITAGNFTAAFSDQFSGVPAWVWLSGAVVLYFAFFSGGEHSRVSRAGRAARRGLSAAQAAY